ncbi:hypothetical protein EDC01DRAFT_630762 [Geopyxis carbonaria]|nr:hypothetical protein EDC01DRAFT_630762 [Geopyxis carbonaria]
MSTPHRHQTRSTTATAKLSEMLQDIKNAEERLAALVAHTAAVEAQLADLQEDVAEKEATVSELDKKIKKQKTKIDSNNKALDEQLFGSDPMMDRLLDQVWAEWGYDEDSIGMRR